MPDEPREAIGAPLLAAHAVVDDEEPRGCSIANSWGGLVGYRLGHTVSAEHHRDSRVPDRGVGRLAQAVVDPRGHAAAGISGSTGWARSISDSCQPRYAETFITVEGRAGGGYPRVARLGSGVVASELGGVLPR